MKTTIYSNYRVEVTPKRGWIGSMDTPEYQKGDCAEIADQIRRHVDGLGSVDVVYDTVVECSHCGSKWTPDEHGLNGCCDQDIQEWKAAHASDPALVYRVLGEHVEEPKP